jgi:L-threonylcarbamoyladenylate synthase
VRAAPPRDPAEPADAPRLAPGQVDRHYAPRAALWPFDGDHAAAAARLAAARAERPALRAGALLLRPPGAAWAAAARLDEIVQMPDDAAAYAARLYAALHALDDAACDVVVVERPPDDPAWAGARDRLARGAHA